jgi:hypothetical protein
MKLASAVNKLCKTTVYGYNKDTLVWDLLPFKMSYPPDGRFIGRSVSFYDRRIFITPEEIDDKYPLIKIGTLDSEELMIYASQENIHHDHTYLFSYTGFNIQGYANLYRLTKTTSASGVKGTAVKTLVGAYPIALEKGFSGPQNLNAAGVYNTRLSGYIPEYAEVLVSDTLEFDGDVYTIDETVSELKLRFIQLTKR